MPTANAARLARIQELAQVPEVAEMIGLLATPLEAPPKDFVPEPSTVHGHGSTIGLPAGKNDPRADEIANDLAAHGYDPTLAQVLTLVTPLIGRLQGLGLFAKIFGG